MTDQRFRADDQGVSPVIGVILMVAITVILAAVIGSFVLGFGDSIEENVQAGATITHDDARDQIKILWADNQNADHLDVNVSSPVANGTVDSRLSSVGASMFVDCTSDFGTTDVSGEEVRVIVTGHAGDSSTVIVSDTIDEC